MTNTTAPAQQIEVPPQMLGSSPSDAEEEEEIIVEATRSGRRVQDEPIRVEVLNREEIEEKLLMRPGNISLVLSETGGLRTQITSPALGAANIRVQGMDGRYTALLADGLPIYSGAASSLGLLQIPPTDLGQVEVIKGSASALYGASALGGVINLVSRRPRDEAETEGLLNVTSRNGQDATAYLAAPLGSGFSSSLTGGYHLQSAHDFDDDGWRDIPAYDRWSVRPRLFWKGETGATLFVTAGILNEERKGGTSPGRTVPDGTPFAQTQKTARIDGGLVASLPVEGVGTAQLRLAGVRQKHRHLFGPIIERDRHGTIFAEASLSGKTEGTSWVGGVALQEDSFRSTTFPAFNYTYSAPGLFGQVEHDLEPDLTLAASARLDAHNEYGTRFSPRLSLLYKPGSLKVRASAGRGFFAPTPFVEEIEATGLSRLEPLGKLNAEAATTGSLDIGYASGPIEANMTIFGSNIDNATQLQTIAIDRVQIVNVSGVTRTRGTELLLRYRRNGFTVTGSYVHVDATEPSLAGGRRRVPLTPRHSGGLVGVWEAHGRGRLGIELYYTGKQPLEDNPYRAEGESYFELGMLGEIVVGKARFFLNAENILDVRQTKFNSLLLPSRAADGRWTVDVWAPTDGFVLNGGLRFSL